MASHVDTVQTYELSEEQNAFRDDLKRFVEDEIKTLDFADLEWREDPLERIPWDVVETAAEELNLWALAVPEEYGGLGADTLTWIMATEELAVGDTGTGHLFGNTWRHTKTIDHVATGDLRDEFFEEFMADPVHILAMAVTEPAHGSDLKFRNLDYTFDTVAEQDGDEWVINGKKRFITNGPEADSIVVLAQTDPSVPAAAGSTMFLVSREYDGIETEHIHEKISTRLYNNGTMVFDNVRVPEERILGELHGGYGAGRGDGPLETSGMALGIGRRAFEDAFEYAYERVQGGTEIINHQVIGHDFADMAMELQAARSLLWTAARAFDAGEDTPDLAPKAKVFTSEIAFDVTRRALEKFGGKGVEMEHLPQKHLRDASQYFHAGGGNDAYRERIVQVLRERYDSA